MDKMSVISMARFQEQGLLHQKNPPKKEHKKTTFTITRERCQCPICGAIHVKKKAPRKPEAG